MVLATPNSLIELFSEISEPLALSPDGEIVPHILFSCPDDGSVDANLRPATVGDGVAVQVKADRTTPWISLNIGFNLEELVGLDYLGIHAVTQSAAAITTEVCFRQHNEIGFIDATFRKHIISYEQHSSHLDQLALAEHLLPNCTKAELILFFESREFLLNIAKLKLFAV